MSPDRDAPPTDRTAIARHSGFAAPLVALSAILAATVLSPTFAWSRSALSDLGVAPSTALLFNGGLLAGALLALPYAWLLWASGRDTPGGGVARRTIGPAFALAAVAMGLVGVFVSGHPLHLPVAVLFYLLVTVTLVADGIDRWRTATGRGSLLLAAVHALVWAGWIAGPIPGGLAVPETVGAAVLAAWVVAPSPVGLAGRRERPRRG